MWMSSGCIADYLENEDKTVKVKEDKEDISVADAVTNEKDEDDQEEARSWN